MGIAVVTASNATRWQSALDRAINEAVDILVEPVSGEVFSESTSKPGTLYVVTRETCTCAAGRNGQPCKHRAAFLAQLGELPLEPEPAGVTFSGNSDRQEIRIDGRHFGFADFADDSGWVLWQGAFPHAKRRGTFCTLAEIERELAAQMPSALPAPTVMPVTLIVREPLAAAA